MFKRILSIILAFSAISSSLLGQDIVKGSKFSDNWSLGVGGGIATPMKHHAFWGDARGLLDVDLHKSITPAFGLGLDTQLAINSSSWFGNRSATAIDHSYLGVYASMNLMNAFAGYTGTRRFFEMELIAGTGWLHSYSTKQGQSASSWGNKLGMNLNFNLGKSKAWTIAFKPAIIWNMGADTKAQGGNLPGYSARYSANAAVYELLAGVTYHFGNSSVPTDLSTQRFMTPRKSTDSPDRPTCCATISKPARTRPSNCQNEQTNSRTRLRLVPAVPRLSRKSPRTSIM